MTSLLAAFPAPLAPLAYRRLRRAGGGGGANLAANDQHARPLLSGRRVGCTAGRGRGRAGQRSTFLAPLCTQLASCAARHGCSQQQLAARAVLGAADGATGTPPGVLRTAAVVRGRRAHSFCDAGLNGAAVPPSCMH